MIARPVDPSEYDAIARLWHAAWHETHAPLMPPALAAIRTLTDFSTRIAGFGDDMRTIGPPGAPLGFCAIRNDELHQLFMAPQARGTGAAAVLLQDGEKRLAARGHSRIWLDASIGNFRAIRFYQAQGWQDRGEQSVILATADGKGFRARVILMDKTLTA